MGSSGAQDPRWQRWIPKMVPLVTVISPAAVAKTVTQTFKIPFPDSRLRVKVSLLFIPVPTGTSTPIVVPASTLWLYETDDDQSGSQGDNVPLTNIVGTSAAPLVIPSDNASTPALDPALRGYSREFVSAADQIEGRLKVTSDANIGGVNNGTWVLQTRYQPQSVSFSPEEWLMIIAHCSPGASNIVING